MINLIPPDAQKQVKREYKIRVASVWLYLLGSAFLIIAILYAPTYVLLRSQLSSFSEEYAQANTQDETFKELETAINAANETAKLLNTSSNMVLFSTIISELESLTTNGVDITNFMMSREGSVVNSIVINGDAVSRSSLSSFRDAIEASELFESATLPLSNFAKDRDIPFSITITLRKKTEQ